MHETLLSGVWNKTPRVAIQAKVVSGTLADSGLRTAVPGPPPRYDNARPVERRARLRGAQVSVLMLHHFAAPTPSKPLISFQSVNDLADLHYCLFHLYAHGRRDFEQVLYQRIGCLVIPSGIDQQPVI